MAKGITVFSSMNLIRLDTLAFFLCLVAPHQLEIRDSGVTPKFQLDSMEFQMEKSILIKCKSICDS